MRERGFPMSLMMIRSRIKPERRADVDAAARRWFSAIEQAQPRGVRYASCRVGEGDTYIVLLEVEDGIENPLPTVPGFVEFQENLKDSLAEPPSTEALTVVGTYNLFGTHAVPV
jgi:hypothetical protein